jgi:hypothetical protein
MSQEPKNLRGSKNSRSSIKPEPAKRRRISPSRAAASRQSLASVLEAADLTVTDAARQAGFSPNILYNFLNGHSASLSAETLRMLAQVIPGASIATLVGDDPSVDVAPVVRPIQVRGQAMAGLMRPAFDLPLPQQRAVAFPIDDAMLAAGAFGVVVASPGAEKIYPDGSILVCIPTGTYEGAIITGKRIILQRIRDGKVEVTVREIDIEANEAWLWLRSTHPEYQAPVRMPYVGGGFAAWVAGPDRFAVAAVVVAAYIPQP